MKYVFRMPYRSLCGEKLLRVVWEEARHRWTVKAKRRILIEDMFWQLEKIYLWGFCEAITYTFTSFCSSWESVEFKRISLNCASLDANKVCRCSWKDASKTSHNWVLYILEKQRSDNLTTAKYQREKQLTFIYCFRKKEDRCLLLHSGKSYGIWFFL